MDQQRPRLNHSLRSSFRANDLGLGKFLLLKLYAAMYCKNLDKAIPNLVAEINAGMR